MDSKVIDFVSEKLCRERDENHERIKKEVQREWLRLLNKKDKTDLEVARLLKYELLRILCSDAFFSVLVNEVRDSPLSPEDMLNLLEREGFISSLEKALWLKVFEPGDD